MTWGPVAEEATRGFNQRRETRPFGFFVAEGACLEVDRTCDLVREALWPTTRSIEEAGEASAWI